MVIVSFFWGERGGQVANLILKVHAWIRPCSYYYIVVIKPHTNKVSP